MKTNIKAQQAFTLIELIIAVGIISILVSISVPMIGDFLQKAKSVTAVQDIERISTSISLYVSVHGVPPDSLADVFMDNLKDPWGNSYQYLSFTNVKGKGKFRKDRNLTPINTDYDLYSMGPDGKSVGPLTAKASRDDIVRAGNGSFVGIAEDY